MKKYSNVLKRSQALILAVAMMLTVICPALCLNISAEEKPTVSVPEGEIVANNYDLTDAEKNLLSSGLLAGGTVDYTVPADEDGLVSVDIDTKTISAKNYENWVPTTAMIVVGQETQETVDLVNGKGVYAYDGDAFSVKVTYELYADVDEDTQETLLSTPAWLKNGIANMDAVAEQAGKLTILEGAMPELVDLANNGIQADNGMTVTLDANGKAAVNAWNDQMTANGGKMNLSAMISDYDSGYDVKYLLENGADVLDEVEDFNDKVESVANALRTVVGNLDMLVEWKLVDETTANQIKLLSNTVTSLEDAFATVPSMDWTAANKGTALIQADLTDTQYEALDTLVSALVTTTPVGEIKNPLLVDTATVQFNMSMYDVTVKVVLETVDGTYESASVKMTFAAGVTATEVEKAIDATDILEDAIAAWTAAGVYVEGKYSVDVSGISGDTLTEDCDFVYMIAPMQYTVSYLYNDTTETLPYGSKVTLEKYGEENKVYDYYVNGEYVPEGQDVVITGDVEIDRKEGKAYGQTNFYQVVTDCFYTTGSKGAAILTSGALNGNDMINVRYPDNNDGSLVVLKDSTLTAKSYPASYNNLTWVPYTYTVIGNGVNVAYTFDGATEVTITEEEYDRVEVKYQLVLTNFSDSKVSDALDLPKTLAEEATAQKNTLDRLASYRTQMDQLDKTKLGALNGVIDVTDGISDEIKAEFKSAVSSIINTCLEGNTLRIAAMLQAYENGGLGYYYQNSEAVINEIDALAGYLSALLETPEKVAALEVLVGAAGYSEYAEKITDLEEVMSDVQAALTAPNAAIDLSSDNLSKLVAALETEGEVDVPAAGPLTMTSGAISVNADSKATVSVVINGVNYPQITKMKNEMLTADEIDAIVAFVDAQVAELGFSDKYYTNNYDKAALAEVLASANVGDLEDMLDKLSYNWTAKTFTVVVDGAEQTISVDNLTINLQASATAGTRFEYVIDGKVITVVYSTTYTFTLEQLDNLFVDGKYVVVLNKVDIAFETLKNMVDDLNASTSGAMEFALVDTNGAYSIVMKLNASNVGALTSDAKGAAMGLVNSGYSYIGVDNNGFIYMDETNTMKISLQAVVDAVMNSGFGMDTVVNVMDANGVINNMKLAGKVVSDKVLSTFGGLLIETTMQLGNTAADAMDLPFYITLGDASAALVQVRNLAAGRVSNYVDANCVDGAAHITLNMPKKAYEAYLAVLLVTDNVDFSSVNAMNSQIAIGFVKDMVDPLFTGNVTTTTLTNTLGKFGYNLDLTGYEKLWQEFCKIYGDLEFTYDENDIKSGMISGNVDISAIIDRMNMGELGKMIVEYDTGIDFNIKLTIDNIGTQYDALYIDVRADGIVNKAGLTTNLPAQVSKLSGGAVIVLLDDVTGDLNFSKTTVLNLNGFKVDGNVKAENSLIIVDTALDKNGEVTGTVSGSVDIIGGKYASDVTAFLKEGYSQNDGVVSNDYFNIVKDPETGDINIELDAGVLAADALPDLNLMLVDIATELICNGYSTNSLYLDGNMVYNVGLVDLVGIYADTNTVDNLVNQAVEFFDSAELAKVINSILDQVTDFDSMQEAVLADEPIMSFDMMTGAWSVELTHVTDGDYLSADIVSGNSEGVYLNVVVTGSEKDKTDFADILGILHEVVDADLSVDMIDGFSATDNKNFVLDWSASARVLLDLTNPDYAILIAVITADGLGDDANAALVRGIEQYYKTESMAALKEAFDDLTVSQLITALKNVNRGDSFSGMLKDLGIEAMGADNIESMTRIEGLFDRFIKASAYVLRRLDIDGNDRKVESFQKSTNLYGATKENIEKTFSRDLFRGYSVTMNLAISELSVDVMIFENVPKFKDDNGDPMISEHEKLAGWQVDTENMLIYLDTAASGITVDELLEVLNLTAYNYDTLTCEIENKSGLVYNGAKLVATASSKSSSHVAVVEYTIIVLGDIDANGRLTTKDPWIISEAMVGNADALTELQMMAADLNRNKRVDVGDTALIAQKFVDWESYFTRLENEF